MDDDPTLGEILDDVEQLVALEPEDLAGYILDHFRSVAPPALEFVLSKGVSGLIDLGDYDVDDRERVVLALSEAWHWLEREGLVVKLPYSKGFVVTRRGQRLKSQSDVRAFISSRALPRALLHPLLVQRVWGAVQRGDFETAIFQAFREVEVAVRDAAGVERTEVGVTLMRKAFDKSIGALADQEEPEPEREALAHLFAGAIGRFKNPSSHRNVEYSLSEATQALMLASMLLEIVENRTSRQGSIGAS